MRVTESTGSDVRTAAGRVTEHTGSHARTVAGRVLATVALALAVLLALGCPPPKGEEMPKRPPAKPVAAGGAAIAEFAADGAWHPSGFLLRPHDLVRFELQGDAADLSNDIVWATVGATVSFSAVSRQPIRVSRMGEVMFRADRTRLGGFEGKTIQVKILNLTPPAKEAETAGR